MLGRRIWRCAFLVMPARARSLPPPLWLGKICGASMWSSCAVTRISSLTSPPSVYRSRSTGTLALNYSSGRRSSSSTTSLFSGIGLMWKSLRYKTGQIILLTPPMDHMLFRIVWTVIPTMKTSTLGLGTIRGLIHGRVVRFLVPLMVGRVLMMAASARAHPTGPMAAAATMAGASPTTPTMAWVGAPRRGHWRPTTVLCASAAYLRRDPRAAGDGLANGALMGPHLFQILMSHSVSRCALGVGLWRVARGHLLQAPMTTLHLLWRCHTLQPLSRV